MTNGKIIVDICKADNIADLKKLVDASKRFWTNAGYSLVSNDIGNDILEGYQSSIVEGTYDQGPMQFEGEGDVILIYQR